MRLRDRLRPPRAPHSRPWRTRVSDPVRGAVALSGRWSGERAGDGLVIVVHGLGGSADSLYARRAAAAAAAAGRACLRLNLRGSDGSGEDIYHAGLTADLHAAVAEASCREARWIALLGYSLGGHVALRYATEAGEPRVAAVAAICAPLDLAMTSRAFDRPARWAYRRYVLASLRKLYGPVTERHRGSLPLASARGIGHIREWDERIVAPRFGFADADDYYRRMSVGPRLGALRVPALLVAAEHDPFVPADSVRRHLSPAPRCLRAVWVRAAGHVAFARSLDLGVAGAAGGLEDQAIGWLAAAAESDGPAAPVSSGGRAAERSP